MVISGLGSVVDEIDKWIKEDKGINFGASVGLFVSKEEDMFWALDSIMNHVVIKGYRW